MSGEAVYFLTEGKSLRIPTPPTMHNAGFHTASLCEIVRWLGERAEELGVNLFPGFPVDSLLVDGDAVRGVRTTPSGLDRNGEPGSGYAEPTELTARGHGAGRRIPAACSPRAGSSGSGSPSPNPQIYALGVKEVWEVKRPLDRVIHTLGWPLPTDAFGGSFMYPLGPNQVSLGLVVGLDYHDATLDVHELLQRMKLHPLFREVLEGGQLLEWGAKTIPEGGWYALPERMHGDGVAPRRRRGRVRGRAVAQGDPLRDAVGDLRGPHHRRRARRRLGGHRCPAPSLAGYDRLVRESYIADDMRRTRNMRLAFKDGLYAGRGEGGADDADRRPVPRRPDRRCPPMPRRRAGRARTASFKPDGTLTFSKVDAVFKAGNATRDSIPPHLLVGRDVTPEVADFYAHLCPAGVYERVGDELRINAPNCVDCKATDVLGPRWTPREGGSGPKYRLL